MTALQFWLARINGKAVAAQVADGDDLESRREIRDFRAKYIRKGCEVDMVDGETMAREMKA